MAFYLSTTVSCILLDIEGTTTPLAFVHDVLFSYARKHLKLYVQNNIDSVELKDDLAKLRSEHATDLQEGLQPPPFFEGSREVQVESFNSYASWLIERDRKSTGLKSLQGKIWRQGYLDGTLKADVFEDVPEALERWHRAGLKICIFSSGSVLAQKLLFAHTIAGDLTRYLDEFFDTTIGPKMEVESYRRIAQILQLPPNEVLFISDVVKELDAAGKAGMQTLLSIRPGNQPQEMAAAYQSIQSFNDIKNPER